MSTIEIVLLVIGVVMMVASFFVTEKLSNQDLDKVAELSTEEMRRILERSLTDAQVKVDNMVDQVIDHSIEKSMEVLSFNPGIARPTTIFLSPSEITFPLVTSTFL